MSLNSPYRNSREEDSQSGEGGYVPEVLGGRVSIDFNILTPAFSSLKNQIYEMFLYLEECKSLKESITIYVEYIRIIFENLYVNIHNKPIQFSSLLDNKEKTYTSNMGEFGVKRDVFLSHLLMNELERSQPPLVRLSSIDEISELNLYIPFVIRYIIDHFKNSVREERSTNLLEIGIFRGFEKHDALTINFLTSRIISWFTIESTDLTQTGIIKPKKNLERHLILLLIYLSRERSATINVEHGW